MAMRICTRSLWASALIPCFVVGVALVGCGQSPPTPVVSGAEKSTPTAEAKPARSADHAVLQTTARNFLTGLLSGDLSQAKRWLTPAAFAHVAIEPTLLTGVPTAEVELEVSEVRVVSATEAVVQCHLKPVGGDSSEELLCLLKRSASDTNSGDWGVSGLAWEAEGDAEPRILQFEPASQPQPGEGFVGPAESAAGARTANAPGDSTVVR